MASAAYAYDYSYEQRQRSQAQSRVRAIPGSRTQAGVSPMAVTLVKVLLVAVTLIAALAIVRVGLTAVTVNTMISEQEITATADQVRSANASLEVQKSMLAAPSHVKQAAAALGMAEATATDTINLGQDVVATNAQGNLSLSESLARAAS